MTLGRLKSYLRSVGQLFRIIVDGDPATRLRIIHLHHHYLLVKKDKHFHSLRDIS